MTTDELRAKFEAWYQYTIQQPGATSYNSMLPPEGDYRGCMWLGFQAAHASRDAEVEALRKDAERYRAFRRAARSCIGNVGVYEGTPTHDPGVGLLLDEAADKAIDAAMAKESGE